MDFITIKKSHSEADLWILKTKLESESIPTFMKNQYVTQIMSHIPAFSVELQVRAEDLERAKEIFESLT